jgi:hypothetical protein
MFIDFLYEIRFNKYKNILFNQKNYIQRVKFLRLLKEIKFKTNFDSDIHVCKSCIFFSKILTNKKKFFKFYKKFNTHLKLKSVYDSRFVAISNKNACLKSYLIFSKELLEYKNINLIQKLNTILKINDIIILTIFNKDYDKSYQEKKLFEQITKNINYEARLLKKFLI